MQIINEENLRAVGLLVWPIVRIVDQLNGLRPSSDDCIVSPVFQASIDGPPMVVKIRVTNKTPGSSFITVHMCLYNCQGRSFRGWFELTLFDVSGKPPLNHWVQQFDGSRVPVTDSIGTIRFIERSHLSGPGQFIRQDLTFLILQVKPVGELEYPAIPQVIKDLLRKFTNPTT